jgi:hypothetical protein
LPVVPPRFTTGALGGRSIKKLWLLVAALLAGAAVVAAALVAEVTSRPDPGTAAVATTVPAPTTTTSTMPPVTTTTLFKVTGAHRREIEQAAKLTLKTVPELPRWLGAAWEYGWQIEETSTLPDDDALATGGIFTRVHLGRISREARQWQVPQRLMLAWVLAHELAHEVDSTERLPIKAERLFARRIGNATLVALSDCAARMLDKEGHWLPAAERPPCDA